MKIEFAEADLEPLVKQVVAEALRQVESDRAKLDGRISFIVSFRQACAGRKMVTTGGVWRVAGDFGPAG